MPAWQPSRLYRLLLQGALHVDDAVALEAWRGWSAAFDLVRTEVDRDITAVLPLMAHRLNQLAPDDPLLPRLRGVVRYSWTRAQLLTRGAAPALHALHHAGIEVLLFKGAAVARAAYDSTGFRPMDDIDILIPPEKRYRAFALLNAAGWQPVWMPRRGQDEFVHGVNFRHTGADIDVHWFALLDGTVPGIDAALWQNASRGEVGGAPAWFASPTDLLLLTLGNAARADGISARWVVDAALLVRRCPQIDWDRFTAAIRARRLTLYAAQMLAWLRAELSIDVPHEVFKGIQAARLALWERLEYRYRAVGKRKRGALYDLLRYARLHALRHPDARTPLHFARRFHNLPGRRHVPLHILRLNVWRLRHGATVHIQHQREGG